MKGDDSKQCSRIVPAAAKKHGFGDQSVLTRGNHSQSMEHWEDNQAFGL